MITYEYPFNERIRTWLRLEHLYDRHAALAARTEALDHHFALVTLFEILDVSTRPDLKSEIMRELDKHKHQLNAYRGNPGIAETVLEDTLHNIENCFTRLEKMTGKIGSSLTDNDWLTALRSRIGIPAGTCAFDLPAYFAWQHGTNQDRQHDLQQWMAPLLPIGESVKLLLALLRSTGQTQKMFAKAGQFQQNLPQGRTFQLLRLQLDPQALAIPEISANRLIVTVRMMQQDANGHVVTKTDSDTDFQLTLCA